MSDIFDEIISKLKEKSKTIKDCGLFPECWGEVVRLEDVLSILQQLKQSLMEKISSGEFLEKLAKLEHEQWITWSQTIADEEKISPCRLNRWQGLWAPYEILKEDEKEGDRVWAKKIQKLILEELLRNEEMR